MPIRLIPDLILLVILTAFLMIAVYTLSIVATIMFLMYLFGSFLIVLIKGLMGSIEYCCKSI